MAEGPKKGIQHYSVGVVWSGDGRGCGEVSAGGGAVPVPIGGSLDLGGCGVGANPEELLLASVGACFINTWAIFLKKLGVTYAEPSLRVTGELGPDPEGGFKMLSATIHARVPATLLAEDPGKIEKTLQLTEKYCITTKVAKAAMPVGVVVEKV
jgi:organic hydroperoxide reductase OsmC/OhrA